jgi:hypothetical protein
MVHPDLMDSVAVVEEVAMQTTLQGAVVPVLSSLGT